MGSKEDYGLPESSHNVLTTALTGLHNLAYLLAWEEVHNSVAQG